MPSSLITGKYVVCKAKSRTEAEIVEDGAVYQEDGKIVAIGKRDDLAAKYQPDEVIGSPDHVVMPGFVNGHHHVGLTPVQLGSRDHALELWFATRMSARNVDSYLDTMYSAFEMIESGITTVQHLQGWLPGPPEQIQERFDQIITAYDDIGMRVSFSYLVRDQNRLVYQDDAEFCQSLPPDVGPDLARFLEKVSLTLDEQLELFEDGYRRYNDRARTRIQLAPANLHWCSDRALAAFSDFSERYQVPMHMHLLETAYQKEYARRRTGATAVRHLHEFGLLGPRLTLGHGVWLTEEDIDLCAETGTNICHNASSNLRLRSGVAPVNIYEKRGMRVAIGIDEAGINDDRDMLQEMRMVLNVHRVPGMDDDVPTTPQVLRMATEDGAHTTPFGAEIGTLEPGKAADLVVMNWMKIIEPFLDLDLDVSILDAILLRGKASGVETVLVGGEPVLRNGRFTRVDKAKILEELAASLRVPLDENEVWCRELGAKVIPHVKAFYDGYLDPEARVPHYRQSSRT